MTTTVTKRDLIERITGSTKLRRGDVKTVVQAFLDQVIDELGHGNRLEFRDFGVFEIKKRASRIAQNPKTLERVEVPARRTVRFKVGRLMKEQVDPVNASGRNGEPARRRGGAKKPKPKSRR